jgi:hypothetical protein
VATVLYTKTPHNPTCISSYKVELMSVVDIVDKINSIVDIVDKINHK